ncbi:MAG: hypothetical protein ACM3U1_00940 [Chloroflexota bacterium]
MKDRKIQFESKRNAVLKLGAIAIALPFVGKGRFAKSVFKSEKKQNPICVTLHSQAVERNPRSKKI